MEIYILRHGDAEPHDPSIDDRERELTSKGRRDVRTVVEQAKRAKFAPQVILTSDLVRARQTAEIAGSVLDCNRVEEINVLRPEFPPNEVWKEVAVRSDVEEVMLVGHEPQFSQLVAFLLEASVAVDVKKGSLIRISVSRRGSPRGILKWMLTPRLARGD
jgi:phosphohistidine phosphatase